MQKPKVPTTQEQMRKMEGVAQEAEKRATTAVQRLEDFKSSMKDSGSEQLASAISELQATKKALDERPTKEELAAASEKAAVAAKEIDDLKAQLEAAMSKPESHSPEHTDAKKQLEAARAEVTKLKEILKGAEEKLRAGEQTSAQEKKQISDLKMQVEFLKMEAAETPDPELVSQIESLKKRLEKQYSGADEAAIAEIDRLKSELEDLVGSQFEAAEKHGTEIAAARSKAKDLEMKALTGSSLMLCMIQKRKHTVLSTSKRDPKTSKKIANTRLSSNCF